MRRGWRMGDTTLGQRQTNRGDDLTMLGLEAGKG